MKHTLQLLLASVFLLSCEARKAPPLSGEGITFKNDLIEAIYTARTIAISEYSHKLDDKSPEARWVAGRVYRKIELTTDQKLRLLQGATNMHPGFETDSITITYCFIPHHTIHFLDAEGNSSDLVICFHCQNIRWPGTKNNPPESFIPTMDRLFKEFGFSPRADWNALASATIR